MLGCLLSESVVGKGNQRGADLEAACAGGQLAPAGEVRGLKPGPHPGPSTTGGSQPADLVLVAFLLLLQPSAGVRAWLQALLMAFSPGAAHGGNRSSQPSSKQGLFRGLPGPRELF